MGSPVFAKFRRLYDQHWRFVLAQVRRLRVPASDVFDVAQDVWMAAYRELIECEIGSPRGFLRTVVWRTVIDHRKRAHRRREVPQADAGVDTIAATAAPERVAVAADILRLIEEIPNDAQREALLRYAVDGEAIEEIAKSQGVSVNTVRKRLALARQRLDEHREDVAPLFGLAAGSDSPFTDAHGVALWTRIARAIQQMAHDRGRAETVGRAPATLPIQALALSLAFVGGAGIRPATHEPEAVAVAARDVPARDVSAAPAAEAVEPSMPASSPPSFRPQTRPARAARRPGPTDAAATFATIPHASQLLIRRMQAALLARDPTELFRLAAEHERHFGDTQRTERESLRARAARFDAPR